jgi:hypothetical protein
LDILGIRRALLLTPIGTFDSLKSLLLTVGEFMIPTLPPTRFYEQEYASLDNSEARLLSPGIPKSLDLPFRLHIDDMLCLFSAIPGA